jgi:hypothetical protein
MPPITTAAARIPNAIQPHGVSSAGSCDDATAAPAAAAAAGFPVVVVMVVAGKVSVVAGRVAVVTGRVWVSVTVTVLEGRVCVVARRVWVSVTVTVSGGRVSVTAGRVSVTVTGGLAGASFVVPIGVVVCVSAPVGDVVVAVVRVRVTPVDSAGWLPLPHPAVAIARTTPRSPAMAYPGPARSRLAGINESVPVGTRPIIVLWG